MIKNFENYRKIEEYGGTMTQWEKTYTDGNRALCVVEAPCTRDLVRKSFEAQELGLNIGCFTKKNARGL